MRTDIERDGGLTLPPTDVELAARVLDGDWDDPDEETAARLAYWRAALLERDRASPDLPLLHAA